MRGARTLGAVIGIPLAIAFGLASFLRRARAIHPRGRLLCATVEVDERVPKKLRALAERLAGTALVRFSTATWNSPRNRRDLLGCALRLKWQVSDGAELKPWHQDLLLATMRRPWTLLFAPFSTESRSFLANRYFTVLPSSVAEVGRCTFQLLPLGEDAGFAASREAGLLKEVERGTADLCLSIRVARGAKRWIPLVRIRLEREVLLDQESFRFDPYLTGQGVEPIGFLNGLRRFAYRASQWGRSRATGHVISGSQRV